MQVRFTNNMACSLSVIAALIISVVRPDCAFSQEQEKTQEQTRHEHGTSRVKLAERIPFPISEAELDRYSVLLVLSNSQRMRLTELYEKYLQNVEVLVSKHRPNIDSLNSQAAEAYVRGAGSDFVYADSYAKFIRAQEDYVSQLVVLEDQLFSSLRLILSEQQNHKMPRIVQHRERARRSWLDVDIDLARIDLSWIIEQAHLEPLVMEDLDDLLREYEEKVTPLFAELESQLRTRLVDLTFLLAQATVGQDGSRLENSDPQSIAARREYEESRLSAYARATRVQVKIAKLNKAYFPRILGHIPEPERNQVLTRFQSLAYPLIYPDATIPEDIHTALLRSPWTKDEHRLAIETLWELYLPTYQDICEQMCHRYEKWTEQMAATREARGFGEYRETMRLLRERRWQVNERIVEQMLGIMPPEAQGSIRNTVDSFHRVLEIRREDAEQDYYPSP